MAPRMMGVGQGQPFLSWGELSPMPRSSVRDAGGDMVFPGSPVVRARGLAGAGMVTELVSRSVVLVRWAGEDVEPRAAPAVELRVTGPFVYQGEPA